MPNADFYTGLNAGTIIRLPDGREGTVVYHHLDGYGIKWGRHTVDAEQARALREFKADDDFWAPDAMLRNPCPHYRGPECVGTQFELVS